MIENLCQEKRSVKMARALSLVLSVILLLTVLLSVSAGVLRISAEDTTESETTAESTTETSAETETGTDWSTTEVNVEGDKDGFLTTILKAVGVFLNWITQHLTGGNYIVALLIFAILIEILMVPFGIKQQKNSIKQAKLRPKEMAIRKKYAGHDDQATRQKMQQEIQELYQSENFNPMSGCLPLVIQLPIIMALYYIIIDPFKYVLSLSTDMKSVLTDYLTTNYGLTLSSNRGTIELLTKIKELGLSSFEGLKTFAQNGDAVYEKLASVFSKIPSFSVFGVNCGYVVTDSAASKWLYAVPVITFLVYFASMKLNRKLTYQAPTTGDAKAQGCSNNVMDIVMPLFSVYITFIVPAAVGIYWIFKSITGIAKQFIMSKVMPYPTFTEEDYKAAEREILGKNPKKKKSSAYSDSVPSGRGRSLHHIDDDEYEDTRPTAPKANKEPYREDDEDTETEQKRSAIEAAPLKDDSDRHSDEEKSEKNDSDSDKTSEDQQADNNTAETVDNSVDDTINDNKDDDSSKDN